jgi:hypothetical protein
MRSLAFVLITSCATPRAAPPPPKPPIATPAKRNDPPRVVEIRKGPIVATAALPTAFDAEKKRLTNGLPISIVIRAFVMDGATVVAANAVGCRVAYDLWNEVFRIVTFRGSHPPVATFDALKRQCASVDRLPLIAPELLVPNHAYTLIVIADVDVPNFDALADLVRLGRPLAPLLGTPQTSLGRETARLEWTFGVS